MKKIDKTNYHSENFFVILNKVKDLILFLLLFLFAFTTTVNASSPYVLPYPSSMPGTIGYKIHLVWEKLMQYWYYGDFGQFAYNLKESDKYLVEAKTLFEYNQYLLGYNALVKSNSYFAQVKPHLEKAKQDRKNITEKNQLLIQAAEKHIEVLQKMESETPKDFTWTPEKNPSSILHIHDAEEQGIQIRKSDL